MLLFGRPKRPQAKTAGATRTSRNTARPPAVIQTPSPPRPVEQFHDTSLPPRYSRIDYPENLPFAAIPRNDMPLHAPVPVAQYPPSPHRLPPPRPLAIEPRAPSSLDLSAGFNNALHVTRPEVVRQHQSRLDSGANGPALCDLIISKLNAVITSIDGETFSGDERELRVYLVIARLGVSMLTVLQMFMIALSYEAGGEAGRCPEASTMPSRRR